MLDKALNTARKLDEHYATTGNVVGPLHGREFPLSTISQLRITKPWSWLR